MHVFQDLFCCQRPDLGRLVKWIADFQRAHALNELVKKPVVNLVGNEEPLPGDARLAAVNGTRFDRGCKRRFEIRARHHNEGVAAAELEHTLFDLPRCRARHCASRFFAPGEGHRLNARIDNRLFHLCGFNQERLKDTVFESGATNDLFNRKRALRHVGGMFQDTDVSRHQSRSGKSKYLPERKIPRHNREDRAERLIADVAPGGIRLGYFIFQKSLAVLGVKSTGARAFFDFFKGSTKQLSHFQRDDPGEFVLLGMQQRRHSHHELRPLRKPLPAVTQKRAVGAAQSLLDFRIVEGRKILQFLAYRRVDRRDWHLCN